MTPESAAAARAEMALGDDALRAAAEVAAARTFVDSVRIVAAAALTPS
jgi:hypothetical protein